MSDTEDPESKTEEATEKKRNDALEKGKTPVSREMPIVAGFLSFLICVSFVFGAVVPRFTGALALMLENASGIPLRDGSDAMRYGGYVLLELFQFLAPPLALFIILGLAASLVQASPRLVFERIAPDISRISLHEGIRRIFGIAGLIELVKAIAKIVIIGGAVTFSLTVDKSILTDAIRSDPRHIPGIAMTLLVHLASVVCITGGVLALADWQWSRYKWRRDMRMSRQELKEEIEQSEGDPFVKARMRSLAQSRARKRMMTAVPRATLVLANPTHYAIALRYVREEGGAPFVMAKGKDLIALKIREIAEECNIPILEKKDLVRAMFEHVEVDRMIPQEFFRPVAELIHFLNTNQIPRARG